jgi:hypothetical protein
VYVVTDVADSPAVAVLQQLPSDDYSIQAVAWQVAHTKLTDASVIVAEVASIDDELASVVQRWLTFAQVLVVLPTAVMSDAPALYELGVVSVVSSSELQLHLPWVVQRTCQQQQDFLQLTDTLGKTCTGAAAQDQHTCHELLTFGLDALQCEAGVIAKITGDYHVVQATVGASGVTIGQQQLLHTTLCSHVVATDRQVAWPQVRQQEGWEGSAFGCYIGAPLRV